MINSVKFSVLMSVYYKERPEYLRNSLESIARQTLMPAEIVLVEDGPLTKELSDVIENFYHENPEILKRVQLKVNSGLGIALNEGMSSCTYELIARMDTDDVAKSDRFQKQITFLINNEEVDMVSSNITEYDDDLLKLLSVRSVPEKHNDIVRMMKKRSPFNHVSVVYKKSVVLACGGYEDCSMFEDYYLWCKLAQYGARFYNLQHNLVDVRMGEALSVRRGGVLYIKDVINFQKKVHSLGFINRREQLYGIAIRSSVALSPSWIRILFYKKVLRR